MLRLLTWTGILAILIIHSLDMLLTENYIGDDYEYEKFLPMRLSIKHLGIDGALWLSRVVTYVLLYLAALNSHRRPVAYLTFLAAVLYWACMPNWLFFLGFLQWP